jgi:thiamine biosynthesis lipoprotein
MGTFVSTTLIDASRDKAQEAMGRAFDEINRLAGLMSRFDEATAVAQLNREGFLKDVPPELGDVLGRALAYYRITQGTFDVSVKPVVDLFKERFAEGRDVRPTEAEIQQVIALVGSDKIELQGRSLRFDRPGMGITLDGIAKGFIVDKAAGVLAAHGIENYLINAGGDIRAVGLRRDKKPWKIAIQDPLKKRSYPDIIHLSDAAVATSGNYEVYFDQEKMFHHIVDPRSGISPQLSTSVSVIAATTMDADALSTSVFVMNPTQGTWFIDTLPNCECLAIDPEGNQFKSQGWKSAAI